MKKFIKPYFQVLSTLSPSLAGKQAFRLFQIPINKKIRPKELPFFDQANSFIVPWYHEDIRCYSLGPIDGPLVLMVHGWESNAASLSGIATPLAEAGYHTVLLNLPAHGYSKLKRTNLKMCSEALREVIEFLQPTAPFSVVAHSFGSAVTTYALSKTRHTVDQLIFLTTPDRITDVFQEFANFIGLSPRAYEQLLTITENLIQEPIDRVNVSTLGSLIQHDGLLIIHDQSDRIIHIDKARSVHDAWDNATLEIIQNTGHYKMLWNEDVIRTIVNKLQPLKAQPSPTQGIDA
ncbi:hypothetical protein BFP72_11275 [Reichenbachiella sp. 5M10]|uniref:alpha/beta hydrolase n=1 Tax=Reichenbachiella sp. 5M10 TaxID=1889772 RepID=UPI000C14D504|nr:alpha/beta fold hydrolase [Reichenbachiella sp. 5M10]PIB35933.1 hypothetical protein BFP72_11275 [Reichenbachiella sp. 5M10]